MINLKTGELTLSDGLLVKGELRKVIQKADFEDRTTKERKPGGFEIEVLCEMEGARDVLIIVKCGKPEQYSPLLRKHVLFPVKYSAYQFGDKDAQVAFSTYDNILPIVIDDLVHSLIDAAEKTLPPLPVNKPLPTATPTANNK